MADTTVTWCSRRASAAGAGLCHEKGLSGRACGGVCMCVSASETHSTNTGMTIAEAQQRIVATALAARAAGASVQVSVQSAFGCGFEGEVPEARVLDIVRRFVEAGLHVVSLADTAGHATPDRVERLFTAVRAIDPAVSVPPPHIRARLICRGVRWRGFTKPRQQDGCVHECRQAQSTDDLLHLWHRMACAPTSRSRRFLAVSGAADGPPAAGARETGPLA
jgi:hypothetical protein